MERDENALKKRVCSSDDDNKRVLALEKELRVRESQLLASSTIVRELHDELDKKCRREVVAVERPTPASLAASITSATLTPAKTAPTKRLIITKMQLDNFKSYDGKVEIGSFHKYISAVMGPNGSGKSNVIDALLFVFGKRASNRRLKKVSELVHRSADFSDLDMATVSVFFHEIIDTEEG
ncbi:hypothetical protein PsorP6_007535 [Peronosclerospora sorghi]|uniref:Uncharacterized protein n=1 Tax=Peronosclerospora sorghi TaxID=230839 RepID=A0ACC0W9B6_9STRA|nr:hypothetical protein PsorP6_007535 [Peronosclerospora sorghi]